MREDYLLQAEYVTVTRKDRTGYKARQKTLLYPSSLMISPGEVIGLIGPNGAGKSTLLRVLAGLVPLAGGTVRFQGQDLSILPPFIRGRSLAYLPQHHIIPYGFSVRDLVALGRLPYQAQGRVSGEQEIIRHILVQTHLAHLADMPVEQLSGGERARAFLARALAVEAPVLLADEPVAAFDPAYVLSVMDLLGNLVRQQDVQKSVCVVLHDLALAARFCTRLLLLYQGRILADGAPDAVLTPPFLAQAFGIKVRMLDQVPVPWSLLQGPLSRQD